MVWPSDLFSSHCHTKPQKQSTILSWASQHINSKKYKVFQSNLTRIQLHHSTAGCICTSGCSPSTMADSYWWGLSGAPNLKISIVVLLGPNSHGEEVHSSPANGNSEVTCCAVVPEKMENSSLWAVMGLFRLKQNSVVKGSLIWNRCGCFCCALSANDKVLQCLALSPGRQCWNSPISFIESHRTKFQWIVVTRRSCPIVMHMEMDSSHFYNNNKIHEQVTNASSWTFRTWNWSMFSIWHCW